MRIATPLPFISKGLRDLDEQGQTHDKAAVEPDICFSHFPCIPYHLIDKWKDAEECHWLDKAREAEEEDLVFGQRCVFVLANAAIGNLILIVVYDGFGLFC